MKIRPVLYLDTSFWRRLDDEENPDLRRQSREFLIGIGRRSILKTSALVFRELEAIPFEAVRRKAFRKVRVEHPRVVTTSGHVHRAVRELLAAGCLTVDHLEDLYHVAYAVVSASDFLVTWDMSDLARRGTQQAVRRYCKRLRRVELVIETPVEVAKWLDVAIG